jgi:hypothetical protein
MRVHGVRLVEDAYPDGVVAGRFVTHWFFCRTVGLSFGLLIARFAGRARRQGEEKDYEGCGP